MFEDCIHREYCLGAYVKDHGAATTQKGNEYGKRKEIFTESQAI